MTTPIAVLSKKTSARLIESKFYSSILKNSNAHTFHVKCAHYRRSFTSLTTPQKKWISLDSNFSRTFSLNDIHDQNYSVAGDASEFLMSSRATHDVDKALLEIPFEFCAVGLGVPHPEK